MQWKLKILEIDSKHKQLNKFFVWFVFVGKTFCYLFSHYKKKDLFELICFCSKTCFYFKNKPDETAMFNGH